MRKQKQNYQNIIFDMVGVLFKFNTRKQLKELGLIRTARYLLTHFKNPVKTFFHIMDKLAHQEGITKKHIKYKQFYLPICAVECFCGIKSTNETVNTLKKNIEKLNNSYFASNLERTIVTNIVDILFTSKKIMAGLTPNKKLINFIKKLILKKTNKIFLLTNIDTNTFDLLKQTYTEIFSLFDGIVGSCDVHLIKPNPDIYKYILMKYNLNPKHSIFIDDQIENVIEANKLGISGIQYKNYRNLKKQLSSFDIL